MSWDTSGICGVDGGCLRVYARCFVGVEIYYYGKNE